MKDKFNLMPFVKILASSDLKTLFFAEMRFLLDIQRELPVTISAKEIETSLKFRLLQDARKMTRKA